MKIPGLKLKILSVPGIILPNLERFFVEFKYTFNHEGEVLNIALSGNLDESMNFADMPYDDVKKIIVDFDGIKLINSSGIVKWVGWITCIHELFPNMRFYFKNCSKLIVFQVNNIQGFMPKGGIIESIFIPYFCEKCDNTEIKLHLRQKHFWLTSEDRKSGFSLQNCICPDCSEIISPDIPLNSFFQFLQ